MGAIVMNNYVASYGRDCVLDAAIGVSGGLDMRVQEHFSRAQRLWQPILAEELRSAFLLGKFGKRVQERLSKSQMQELLRATHVTVRTIRCHFAHPMILHFFTSSLSLETTGN